MFREPLGAHHIGMNPHFRFRGENPGRLENFSDAIFALAITLLLISTSPPTSFAQLKTFARELPAFGLCIALLTLIWHQHFIFFLRYGFRNNTVLFYNTLLLAVVLFYVYPLKFLAKFLTLPFFYLLAGDEEAMQTIRTMIAAQDVPDLMIMYGLGVMGVFVILALMYRYAAGKSADLQLNALEQLETRLSVITNVLFASIPALSVLLAIIFRHNPGLAGGISGFTYFLYWPVGFIWGHLSDKKIRALKQAAFDGESDAPTRPPSQEQ
jgi:uncharacterized membrane protein